MDPAVNISRLSARRLTHSSIVLGRPGAIALALVAACSGAPIQQPPSDHSANALSGSGITITGSEIGSGLDGPYGTRSIALGDFDGDGDLDAAVANGQSESGRPQVNMVYENVNGGFTEAPVFLGNDAAISRSAAVGDIDLDGDLDIVFGNFQSQNVYHLNQGNGEFSAARQLHRRSGRTWQIALVDLDGDGDLDVVEGLDGARRNRVYLNSVANDGTLSFEVRNLSRDELNTRALAIGDVDGDGILDIVTGDHDSPNHVYYGNGNGRFSNGDPIQWHYARNTVSLALADLDGDNLPDLIEGAQKDDNGENGETLVYRNNGRGGFEPPEPLPGSLSAHSTASLLAIDADSDGDIDIIEGNNGSWDHDNLPDTPEVAQPKRLYVNDGLGGLELTAETSLAIVSEATYDLEAGDIDNDGVNEFVAANQGSESAVYSISYDSPPVPRRDRSVSNETGGSRRLGPLRVHANNPRYFEDPDGNVVYLAGHYLANTLQDVRERGVTRSVLEWNSYVRYLESNNINLAKFVIRSTTGGSPAVYERTGPKLAVDGQPAVDLTKLNQAFFDQMAERVADLERRGIYVVVMFFNRWDTDILSGSSAWETNLYNDVNNINGIDGDTNGDGRGEELLGWPLADDIRSLELALIHKIVDTVNPYSNVIYEVANEPYDAADWQAWVTSEIVAYQDTKPYQHPVGQSASGPRGTNEDLFTSNAHWMSPGDGRHADDFDWRRAPPEADGRKVVIIDNDHVWAGDECPVDAVWKFFTRGFNPLCYGPRSFWTIFATHPGHRALEATRHFAEKLDLSTAVPDLDVCSSGYCLSGENEYLFYQPEADEPLSISPEPGEYRYEWFDTETNRFVDTGDMAVHGYTVLTPPTPNRVVLHLSRRPTSYQAQRESE